jgi:hypothetical protein
MPESVTLRVGQSPDVDIRGYTINVEAGVHARRKIGINVGVFTLMADDLYKFGAFLPLLLS